MPPEMVIDPLYEPAERPVVSTEIVVDAEFPFGREPEVGLIVSQDCVDVAVQFSVPPPVFWIKAFWDAGFWPPIVPSKEKLVLETPISGGGSSVTLIFKTRKVGLRTVVPDPK